MFGWIKNLVAVPPVETKEEPRKPLSAERLFERALTDAEEAVSVPSWYFHENSFDGRRDCPFYPVRLDTVKTTVFDQSPFHLIMTGGHNFYPEEFRERLWAEPRYRRAVAHVLHNVKDIPQMERALDSVKNTGYNGPMINVARRAIKEGLVGLSRKVGPDGSWIYV